jgi:3-dehydroquinate dehydratase/shikimate dehydrogenase
VKTIGACNTIITSPQGWKGFNTDAHGFSDSLLEICGQKDLRGRKVCVIGAGGIARAVASAVYRLKGKALILNRTEMKAWKIAMPYNFHSGALDSKGINLMGKKFNDIIIQATPVGMDPNVEGDPLEYYKFSGKELMVDMIYSPPKTRCLQRAESAGCKILNGYDILLRQVRYQYSYFTEKEFPPSLINRVEL